MSNIVGIDFSIIADLRKSVTVKLTATQSVELPLITARDAPKANLIAQEFNILQGQYSTAMARIDLYTKATVGTLDKDTYTVEDGLNVLESVNKDAANQLGKLRELTEKSDELTDRVLSFIDPYISHIVLEDGRKFIDILRLREPAEVSKVFLCMYYGEGYLKSMQEAEAESDADVKGKAEKK